jgi:3-hydroxyacyl-CoA dehydrogenase
MGDVSNLSIEDGVGILTLDSPPVNALSVRVRAALVAGFTQFAADPAVRAIVLICNGRTFVAGADISEFGKPPMPPSLREVLDVVEASSRPVVAAIHGTALGGGLELALTCHYRIAVPSAKVGLPEVNLGLLPGAGGTQRLPRIVGVERALEMITNGKPIGARQALEWGVLDALADETNLRGDAIAFARNLLAAGRPLQRVRDRDDAIAAARGKPEIFAAFRKQHARNFRGFRAPENIIKAIEAAVALPFDQGMARERQLFEELLTSNESAAQRYAFFAERETAKVSDIPADTPVLPVNRVGVIGAGTMGGGIAMNFLNAGIQVTLVEMTQEALDRGLAVIRKNYENTASKGRMTMAQVEQRMALITPTTEMQSLANVDLVIEAVYESMDIKQQVFTRLDAIVRQGAILASNTSYLDLDKIAAATNRPEFVIGLHFFSPANVMRLLEVVRGKQSDKSVIATAMKLAKQISKVPVLSRVCYGFIANRVMTTRSKMANMLVLQGPTPQEIDRAIVDYGFAMGPFQMMDLVGLDVIGRDSTERSVRGDLVKMGRLGQKKDGGFYDYDEKRNSTPSPVAAEAIAAFARDTHVEKLGPLTPEQIVARLLYPVVNEGARLLEEGIAMRASDIDVATMMGYNWPVYRGGPMMWADTVGLDRIVAGLREMATIYGDNYQPARLLTKLAAEGGRLHDVKTA